MTPLLRSYGMALLTAGLLLLIVAPSWATTITYGSYNRPVLFEGVSLNGTNFDVTVTWGSNYTSVYSGQPPMFLGDDPGAHTALQALVQALIDDSYTQSPLQSYMNVPYHNTGVVATSWGVDLYNGAASNQTLVSNYTNNFYSNTGYSVWTVNEPIKTDSATWGKIKALFR